MRRFIAGTIMTISLGSLGAALYENHQAHIIASGSTMDAQELSEFTSHENDVIPLALLGVVSGLGASAVLLSGVQIPEEDS